jgi:ATP-dependent DNA helicase RecG
LPGVTIENIAEETRVRNKLIAEVLDKCEFVEQFGNGVDLMIKNQLSSGKNLPDYSKTTDYSVTLSIDGDIIDAGFARYVSKIALEKNKDLTYKELIVLTQIKQGKMIQSEEITSNLYGLGLIEKVGTRKYILSKKYYSDVDKKGEYTRRRGLDKSRNKELILEHIKHHGRGYMGDFLQIFNNDIPRPTINSWLDELKKDNKIEFMGNPQIVRGKNRGFWRIKVLSI